MPARKSTTNAVQLGGFPYAMGVFAGIVYFLFQHDLSSNWIIHRWMVSAGIVVLYGYLDDKYELRPIAKLIFQFVAVTFFAVTMSFEIISSYQVLAFIVLMFWSLGTMNGANLLDGLDTLTIKMTISNLMLVAYLFHQAGDYSYFPVLISFATGLGAFYFFNKLPSIVHMGEIGGSFIGLANVFLGCLIFDRLEGYPMGARFVMSVMPLNIYMVETGISFLRRLYNKRSLFSGDKLHVHHLLRDEFKIKINNVGTVMAIFHGVALALPLTFLKSFPVSSYFFYSFSLIGLYLYVGKNQWKGTDTLEMNPKSLFEYLRKKDVRVIESSQIDDFHIEFLNDADGLTEDDLIINFNDADINDKKAS
ncbi:MAG: MraY family glycosyltransferase [Bacteriovoracaceae bacterium]